MNSDFGTLIEPAPISFAFGAPGWYVLAAIAVCILLALTWLVLHIYRKNKYRKSALNWLTERERILNASQAFDVLLYDAVMLIKRIAMTRYGRDMVAEVNGKAWIDFLNKTGRGTDFSDADSTLLDQGLYQSNVTISETEATAFVHKTKKWIASHRYAL